MIGSNSFARTIDGRSPQRRSGTVIYDRTFVPDPGEEEARAVIVEDSDDNNLEFRFGIIERSNGTKEALTFQGKIEEKCAGLPDAVKRVLREDLYRQAKGELEREIRIATDPHYDRPEREIY